MKPKILSMPGDSRWRNPLEPSPTYFAGEPPHLRRTTKAAEKRVLSAKRRKPARFVRPRTPAVAPAKTETKNLTLKTVDRFVCKCGP